jgi:hypothetical protein
VSQARANLDVESAARRRALRASERAAEKRRIGYLVQAAVGWAHVAPAELAAVLGIRSCYKLGRRARAGR